MSAASRAPDVVIIGAGIIGSSIAYALSRATRLRIVVLERGTAGCEASNAAAGVLAVASTQARRGVLLGLRHTSAEMFPAWVSGLSDDTDGDVGYRRNGILSLACSPPAAAALQNLVAHRVGQGFRCEWLEGAALRSLEPATSARLVGGALFPDEAMIDSQRLVIATVAAARRRGVEFRLRASARSIAPVTGGVRVTLEDEVLDAGVAVVAAGAWSAALLARAGVKVPLRPARGEMLAVRPLSWQLHHTLYAGDSCLVPRSNGEIAVGSTTAFVGFDKRVTPAGVAALRARAIEMIPAMRDSPVSRSWAGLRPCSTIRRPIIAPLPGMENVILATGHHRNGILLAPITAKIVTDMIIGAPPTVPLRPLSYRKH